MQIITDKLKASRLSWDAFAVLCKGYEGKRNGQNLKRTIESTMIRLNKWLSRLDLEVVIREKER